MKINKFHKETAYCVRSFSSSSSSASQASSKRKIYYKLMRIKTYCK
jgi:hypothetical protein